MPQNPKPLNDSLWNMARPTKIQDISSVGLFHNNQPLEMSTEMSRYFNFISTGQAIKDMVGKLQSELTQKASLQQLEDLEHQQCKAVGCRW